MTQEEKIKELLDNKDFMEKLQSLSDEAAINDLLVEYGIEGGMETLKKSGQSLKGLKKLSDNELSDVSGGAFRMVNSDSSNFLMKLIQSLLLGKKGKSDLNEDDSILSSGGFQNRF